MTIPDLDSLIKGTKDDSKNPLEIDGISLNSERIGGRYRAHKFQRDLQGFVRRRSSVEFKQRREFREEMIREEELGLKAVENVYGLNSIQMKALRDFKYESSENDIRRSINH